MKITIKHITKRFGDHEALKDVNLELEEGMHGLLGPNGAGKTTMMRILTTLLPQTEGEVFYDDIPVSQHKEIRKIIGYLPQEFSLYPNMTVYETMVYFYLLADKKPKKNKIMALLKEVHLEKCKKVKVKALSGGMKRRLGIATTLIHNPKVLVVDEPTAGLDPEERIRFRNLLSHFGRNKVVILSTHIAEDIALSCNSLTVMKKGRIVYNGSLAAFMHEGKGYVWQVPVSLDDLEEVGKKYTVISTVLEGNIAKLKVIADHQPEGGIGVTPTLEDAYMHKIQEVE